MKLKQNRGKHHFWIWLCFRANWGDWTRGKKRLKIVDDVKRRGYKWTKEWASWDRSN